MIVRQNDRVFIRHDENERFRDLGGNVRSERRGNDEVTTYERDGAQIITITDESGSLIRRIRRGRDGREVVIIDNGNRRGRSLQQNIVALRPPPLRIPQERYVVDADHADETIIYETLIAQPIAPLPRRYTLDEVRYSPDLRARMRSVDVNTINFDTAAWEVPPDQVSRLATLAQAINQALQRNPNEVFLVEGYTDAVGSDIDNISLSDRRAQSVASVLTTSFNVPPENLVTQGYGAQYPKVQTQTAARENRRVTLRRVTPLLTAGATAPR
jgi:outer membrane protein OmpA-like peptidoglycan-associated protein